LHDETPLGPKFSSLCLGVEDATFEM